MNALADRRFQRLLGLSVLLHGALLVALPKPPLKAPEMPALLATIRLALPEVSALPPAARPAPVEAPQRPAAAPQARRVEATPVLAAPQPARPVVRQRPAAVTPSEAAAPPASHAATPPAPPVSPAAIAAAATQGAEAPAAAPVTTPRPAAPRPAADALDGYRRQLTELFARGHEYPRVAALRGWEGEVRLRLRVARRGQLLGVRVDRSSGFDVLDQDAVALLEGHGSLPPLPEALEVAEIEVVVPITYRLRKAT